MSSSSKRKNMREDEPHKFYFLEKEENQYVREGGFQETSYRVLGSRSRS